MIDNTLTGALEAIDTAEVRRRNACPPWCTAGHHAEVETPEHCRIVSECADWYVSLSKWQDEPAFVQLCGASVGLSMSPSFLPSEARSLAAALARAADLVEFGG